MTNVFAEKTIGELRTTAGLPWNVLNVIKFIDLMCEHVKKLDERNCGVLTLEFFFRQLWTKEKTDNEPFHRFKGIAFAICRSYAQYSQLEETKLITGSDESLVHAAIMNALPRGGMDYTDGFNYLQSLPLCKALSKFHKSHPYAGAMDMCLRALMSLNEEVVQVTGTTKDAGLDPDLLTTSVPQFPSLLPESRDVRELCHRLKKGLAEGLGQIVIAREFTGEKEGDDKRAKSLLTQARRFRPLWDDVVRANSKTNTLKK